MLLLKSLFKSFPSLFQPTSTSVKSQNLQLGQNLAWICMRFPTGILVTLVEVMHTSASSDVVRVLWPCSSYHLVWGSTHPCYLFNANWRDLLQPHRNSNGSVTYAMKSYFLFPLTKSPVWTPKLDAMFQYRFYYDNTTSSFSLARLFISFRA